MHASFSETERWVVAQEQLLDYGDLFQASNFVLLSGSGDECSPLVSSFNGRGKAEFTYYQSTCKNSKEEDFREESIEMNLSDRQKSGLDISFRFFFVAVSVLLFLFLFFYINISYYLKMF